MKILVATAHMQGYKANDYHHCIEGELVWLKEPCVRDRDNPDGPCGCGRGFSGAASHRATTTAQVVESELTREDLVLAFETTMRDGGWCTCWADVFADENLQLADQVPAGTVLERHVDGVYVRGVRIG